MFDRDGVPLQPVPDSGFAVEAAVKELSSIVKSTSTHGFSIKGSVYEVHT